MKLTGHPGVYSALSGGGAGLHHLLAALPHRQEPVRPGGQLWHGHAEPEVQHGLHGALLPQRFYQPRRLQPHVTEVPGRRQAPLPAAPQAQTSPPQPETVLRERPHLYPEWKPDWGLRGLSTVCSVSFVLVFFYLWGWFDFIAKRLFAGGAAEEETWCVQKECFILSLREKRGYSSNALQPNAKIRVTTSQIWVSNYSQFFFVQSRNPEGKVVLYILCSCVANVFAFYLLLHVFLVWCRC